MSESKERSIEAMFEGQRKKADKTRQTLLRAIRRLQPVTSSELQIATGISKSQVRHLLDLLAAEGRVRTIPGATRRVQGRGNPAALHELGDGRADRPEMAKKTEQPTRQCAFRHPQDVAFFGGYERRAA